MSALVRALDILQLYFSYADVRVDFGDSVVDGRFIVFCKDSICFGSTIDGKDLEVDLSDKTNKVYLILDHTSDLTAEQKREYHLLCHRNTFKPQNVTWLSDTPMSLWWLIKNGVDAFDLIDNGQAVHKKTGLIQVSEEKPELTDEVTYLQAKNETSNEEIFDHKKPWY